MHTLLIVDDERNNLKEISDILTRQHYHLLTCQNATIGFDIAISEQPEAIITDWQMPHVDGIAFVSQLKAHPETKDIPVLMTTGVMITPEHLHTALEAGAIDYIRKPFVEVELLARVSSALRISESHRMQLQSQSKELVSISLLLEGRNNLFGEIRKKIADRDLKGIQDIIESDLLLNETSLHSFVDNYKKLDHYFFDKLNEKLKPGEYLTQANLKILVALKLGMETKEIAYLLNLEVASVRKAKHRIKKKFDVELSDEEYDFNKFVMNV